MKTKTLRLILLAGSVLGILFLTGGVCGTAGVMTLKKIVEFRFDKKSWDYKTLLWCTNGLPIADKIEKMLGGNYLILLQNNRELRATGGFMGSYVRAETTAHGLKGITVHDIYQPDGQLPGHVEPPYPIQESFRQGWWKLRDSNWDPDYASAAADINWFMGYGGEEKVKGIVAINTGLMAKWLKVVDGVWVQTYGVKVTDKNLYSLAQTYAETRTEGNKTEKREFLGAVGTALWEKTKSLEVMKLIKLIKLMAEELNQKQILVWFKDKDVQADITRLRWDGGLLTGWDGSGDYLYVVDSNLGANKADCCIERKIRQQVSQVKQVNQEKIELSWQNENEFSGAKPPVFWGGDYVDYVRVIVPDAAVKIKAVTVNSNRLRQATGDDFKIPNSLRQEKSTEMYVVEKRPGEEKSLDLQMIGFWILVKAGETGTAEIELESTRGSPGEYKTWVKRQPGIEVISYELLVDGKIEARKEVERDQYFKVKL
jgi:hypothetical protein